ncbi:BMP family ABC transporter substrate-binding protein [Agromyces sp. ISL-38]|uniref:BMP family ABC transporter substrate-binding protein n=1 Tax=Agromyces sp. ISL-38 TaxID=2819107 RepID=UPI001BEBAA45|nr:BMP family ABC transporter substrate-binding protein [Agromyces sp. ISL-38]MBT2498035.1 BMP family ABC transporter substrate-binding protein [Agromyces sp. ISL-38]
MSTTTPRLIAAAAALGASALVLSGCAGSSAAGNDSDDTFSATLVGGVAGDLSYTDTALAGLAQAKDELDVTTKHIETPDAAQGETLLRSAIPTSPDLLLSITLPLDTVVSIAEQYPDQLIALPDQADEGTELPDNVAAYTINVHEGSFLAGVVAGAMTESHVVGAIIGGQAPGLDQFALAYKQGVLAACPDCEVKLSYLNFQFADPALGKSTALDLHSDGADVIFQVAGGTGTGVIEAAKEGGFYAIGVDSDQDSVAPGTVITSMLKRVDANVLALITAAEEGDFASGFTQVGLADGATGLSWDTGSTVFEENAPTEAAAKIPAVKDLVEDFRAQILDGSLEVCDALNAPDSEACAALG